MKNEKKENENENVMSSQEMRACMNKIFDNGMATKRYDAMIAMLNMIGHSVLLLNDIVVRGDFCVLTLDDLNLLEYDVEEHSDKNIMDDNKMNVIKLLNICCLGNPKEYLNLKNVKSLLFHFLVMKKL